MQRRGVDPESQPLVFIGDGAEWIWNRVKDLRNTKSIEILDFYHAADYLSKTCKELYGEETPDYWAHYPRWTKLLWRGKATVVIEELTQMLAAAPTDERRKALRLVIGYLKDHLPRMDYPPLSPHEATHRQRDRGERLQERHRGSDETRGHDMVTAGSGRNGADPRLSAEWTV